MENLGLEPTRMDRYRNRNYSRWLSGLRFYRSTLIGPLVRSRWRRQQARDMAPFIPSLIHSNSYTSGICSCYILSIESARHSVAIVGVEQTNELIPRILLLSSGIETSRACKSCSASSWASSLTVSRSLERSCALIVIFIISIAIYGAAAQRLTPSSG